MVEAGGKKNLNLTEIVVMTDQGILHVIVDTGLLLNTLLSFKSVKHFYLFIIGITVKNLHHEKLKTLVVL